jgi:hypothetical protein
MSGTFIWLQISAHRPTVLTQAADKFLDSTFQLSSQNLYALYVSLSPTGCYARLIFLNSITLRILSEEYKLRSSSLRNLVQLFASSQPLNPNTSLYCFSAVRTPTSNSTELWFECEAYYQLSWLRLFMVFLGLSRRMPWVTPWNRTFPSKSLLAIHEFILRCVADQ